VEDWPLTMRASDGDRQAVVERLRAALDEGRLKMEEYVERVGQAYQAVTYGDLAALHADLPADMAVSARPTPPAAVPEPAPPAAAPQPAPPSRTGAAAGLPTPLKVLWTIWLSIVAINVVVWVLVMGTTGHFIYPWPVWVAGPSGAVLFAVSAGVQQIRRGRQPPRQLPPPPPSGS
jgi:hypothetical protein